MVAVAVVARVDVRRLAACRDRPMHGECRLCSATWPHLSRGGNGNNTGHEQRLQDDRAGASAARPFRRAVLRGLAVLARRC